MAHRTRRLFLAAALLVATFSPACSSDDTTSPDATLVGAWNVTHLAALGSNFISLGMTVTATFTSSDTYSLAITGDLVGICGESITNCTETGTYAATATQLTLTPTGDDPVTFSYAITGSTMTWTGFLDGNPVTVTLVKQ